MMGVQLYRRGRIWWISVSRDGTQERWSLRTSDRKIAARAARIYEERLAKGQAPRQPRAKSPTFAKFSETWLERKATSRRRATVDGYRMTVAEVTRILGPMLMAEITRTHARQVAEALVTGGRGARARESVERYLSYMQALFSDAMEELRDAAGRPTIPENPFARKGRLIEGLVDSGPRDHPETDPKPYTTEELEALERAALDEPDRLKILLGLDAGLRRSEVFGLHRGDLELERQWTWVRRRVSRGEVSAPKTKRSRRRVPLTDRLTAAVRAHLRQTGLASVPLFSPRRDRGGLGYEDAKRFSGRFLAALRAAGIAPGEHPFHRLRHTWVSRLLDSGVEPYLVSKWAGHRSTAFTEEHYAEWIPGSAHRERVNRPQHSLSTISAQTPLADDEGVS